MADVKRLEKLAKVVRYYILRMTTKAGSGHATSALSATDLMVALFFDKLRFDLNNPDNPANDRVIFSKGHASPLLYALYAACGALTESELDTYRQFQSPLEGHPTPRFKFAEVATGSLGQGLSIGLGMALAVRQATRNQKPETRNSPKVYVLMGDSEMSEGSVWEAIQLASYCEAGNLVGIIDVNRLGQSGETMLGWDTESYKKRVEAFGWNGHIVDGHDFGEILDAIEKVGRGSNRPQMIIAKTVKGRGVSFLEDKEGWHGKALSEEDFEKAVAELGEVDKIVRGKIRKPVSQLTSSSQTGFESSLQTRFGDKATKNKLGLEDPYLPAGRQGKPGLENRTDPKYKLGEMVATRKAYGEIITKLGEIDERIVCLDAEVKNSTFAEIFKEKFPERFFEMFIAEQNMVGVALGLAKRGKIPFVSTFAAFFTRAYDQIRMSAITGANIKFVGSHAGVSIGEDGPSQMGLEDLAMFRAVFGSVVFCPADAVACAKLVKIAAETEGLFYIRTARPATPVIYKEVSDESSLRSSSDSHRSSGLKEDSEEFRIGGSKVVKSSNNDRLTIVACGVTVFEAIKAADELARKGICVRVIDAYSIKPIDEQTLRAAANETNNTIITCEDHWAEGGLGDAVLNVFAKDRQQTRFENTLQTGFGKMSHPGGVQIHKLAVSKLPMSGKGEELLEYEGISAKSIEAKVKEILGKPERLRPYQGGSKLSS